MRDDEDDTGESDTGRASSLSDLADQLDGDADTPASESQSQSLSDLAERIRRQRGESDGSDDGVGTAPDAELGEWDVVESSAESNDRGGLDPKTEAVLELTRGTANVLLSGPSGVPAGESLCSRLMEPRTERTANLLVIAISDPPGPRLSMLESYLGARAGEMAVVDVQTYNRERTADRYDGSVEIRSVSNAQDLRRIGIVTSKILSDWEETAAETTVCVHSLSDLLGLNDDHQRVFRFLHVLRGRVQSAEARAHYHFDPNRHDDRAVRTFRSLFDTVIQFDRNGSVSVL